MRYPLILFLLSIALNACQPKNEKADKSFSVIAFGDMPYRLPEDYAKFESLIEKLNQETQDFNVFVGDFKSSSTVCSDEAFLKIKNYFNTFNKALIYTPGDNEWTDCWREEAGSYHPEERLAAIRNMFFKETKSFGKWPLQLMDESLYPNYKLYKENKLWMHRGICFSTLHVVGSNNYFMHAKDSSNAEYKNRNAANLFWLHCAFEMAKDNQSKALVIFAHADMFNPLLENTGFTDILKLLAALTEGSDFQVLLVNGDAHNFVIDKPLKTKEQKTIMNFTRLQVFGDADMRVAKITFDPEDSELFRIQALDL